MSDKQKPTLQIPDLNVDYQEYIQMLIHGRKMTRKAATQLRNKSGASQSHPKKPQHKPNKRVKKDPLAQDYSVLSLFPQIDPITLLEQNQLRPRSFQRIYKSYLPQYGLLIEKNIMKKDFLNATLGRVPKRQSWLFEQIKNGFSIPQAHSNLRTVQYDSENREKNCLFIMHDIAILKMSLNDFSQIFSDNFTDQRQSIIKFNQLANSQHNCILWPVIIFQPLNFPLENARQLLQKKIYFCNKHKIIETEPLQQQQKSELVQDASVKPPQQFIQQGLTPISGPSSSINEIFEIPQTQPPGQQFIVWVFGTSKVLSIKENLIPWHKFSQKDLSAMFRMNSFKQYLMDINAYIDSLNSFRKMKNCQAKVQQGKIFLNRLVRVQSLVGLRGAISLRFNSINRKILVRYIDEDNSLQWIDFDKIKINYTGPQFRDFQLIYLYLLSRKFIEAKQTLELMHSNFFYLKLNTRTVFQRYFERYKMEEFNPATQRCIRCMYMIYDLPFKKCTFCENYCHQQCCEDLKKTYSWAKNDWSPWLCPQCQPCSICFSIIKNQEPLKCMICRVVFHDECGKIKGVQQLLRDKYICQNCLKCRICNKKLRDKQYNLVNKEFFCQPCYKIQTEGNYCSICMKGSQGIQIWVQCDAEKCDKWIHKFCDNYLRQNAAKLEHLKQMVYWCPICRNLKRRQVIGNFIETLKIFDQYAYFIEPQYQKFPDYASIIAHPMCLNLMKEKCDEGLYDLDSRRKVQQDFKLIISNALTYNMPKDHAHYEARILNIMGQKVFEYLGGFLQPLQDQKYIEGKIFQDIKKEEKKLFSYILDHYPEIILNYKSKKIIVEVKKRTNIQIPLDNFKFSSTFILGTLFKNSTVKLTIKRQNPTIEQLFTIPTQHQGSLSPIRINECYYHPGKQAKYFCDKCMEAYCCVQSCTRHLPCTHCLVRNCSCEVFGCGCPPLSQKQKKTLEQKIAIKGQGVRYILLTQNGRYCYKCVLQNMKNKLCKHCKTLCYNQYQKCKQCQLYYHLACQGVILSNPQLYCLPNMCVNCSTQEQNYNLADQFFSTQGRKKIIIMCKILHFIDIIEWLYIRNGIRLTPPQIQKLIYNNYDQFSIREMAINQLKLNLEISMRYRQVLQVSNLIRDGLFDMMEMLNGKSKLQHGGSFDLQQSLKDAKERQKQQFTLYYPIKWEKYKDTHILKIKFHETYIKHSIKLYLAPKKINLKSVQDIKNQLKEVYQQRCLYQYSYSVNNPNHYEALITKILFYCRDMREIMTQLDQQILSKQQRTFQNQLNRYVHNLNCWDSQCTFTESQNMFLSSSENEQIPLPAGIYNTLILSKAKGQNYMQFESLYSEKQYPQRFIPKFTTAPHISTLLHQRYYSYMSQYMSFMSLPERIENILKQIEIFLIGIYEENKVCLRRGNTCVQRNEHNDWRVLKKYQKGKILQLRLWKNLQAKWYFAINGKDYLVETIQDIIKKLRPYIEIVDFKHLGAFLGFTLHNNFYKAQHFTGFLQTNSLAQVSIPQRIKMIKQVTKTFKWQPNGVYSNEVRQGVTTNKLQFNMTKKKIPYLSKKSKIQEQPKFLEPPYITFQDIKQDLGQYAAVPAPVTQFNIKQPTNEIFIGPSKIHKLGLFSKKSLRKNTIVAQYIGEIISEALADLRQSKFHYGCYMFALNRRNHDKRQIIDATFRGNMARYLNHSCDPNCKARIELVNGSPRIFIYTIKDVEKNQELTYDYQFKIDINEKIVCTCGAKNCQGRLN